MCKMKGIGILEEELSIETVNSHIGELVCIGDLLEVRRVSSEDCH
jgi:hypothetical protein